MKVMIVAGGTLGHIKPALVIAHELRSQQAKVMFIADKDPYGCINKSKFPLILLRIGHFKSVFSLSALLFPFQFFRALSKTLRITANKPDVVLGMGGYVTLPVILAAWLRKIPVFLCEQNIMIGRANRIALPFARKIFLAFEDSKKYVAEGKAVVTGNPVETNLHIMKKAWKKQCSVLIYGGTNGAPDINTAILKDMQKLRNIRIIHITGPKYYHNISRAYQHSKVKAVVKPYTAEIAKYYAQADVVVCRAGATSLAELFAAGKPSILVPHPTALDDHQTPNARYAAKHGAALFIKSSDLAKLMPALFRLINHPSLLKKMAVNARRLVMPYAARDIADIIIKGCSGNSKF